MPNSYFLSLADSRVTYLANNRLFNFRVEPHGDHTHCDLSVHVVRLGVARGGSRNLPVIHFRDFGVCRFRLPLSDGEYDLAYLVAIIESEEFQEFAFGPLDDLAGSVDPERFGMMPD